MTSSNRPSFSHFALVLGLSTLTSAACLAGPNEGGVLVVHARPDLVYCTGLSYCGQSGLATCEEAVTRLDGTATRVWHVLAAFPPDSNPRLSALTFGVTYDSSVEIVEHGHCADFELATGQWPTSGEGTAITWNAARTGILSEVYWFAGYHYAGGPASFAPSLHPNGGSYFADDSVPARLDAVAGYGELGFNQPGSNPCGSWPVKGACCVGDECQVLTEQSCMQRFGTYWGDGTTCDPNPCTADPIGACCFDDGTCQALREWRCSLVQGIFHGGETCDSSPCPPAGACCLSSVGQCRMVVQSACDRMGGDFYGEGVPCDPNPCPVGGCCLEDAGCVILSAYDCRNEPCGSYLGDGTTCDPNPCQTTGACCFNEGICIGCMTQSTCEGNAGTWMGVAVSCSPDPCPPPVGCGTVKSARGPDPDGFAKVVGPASGAVQRHDDPGCGLQVFNSDGTYENGGSWAYGGVQPPYIGAFAECYTVENGICAVDFDFARDREEMDRTMDVYVWGSTPDGCPGEVVCVRTGVDPGPMEYLPNFSRHSVAVNCDVSGTIWAGYWPNWPGEWPFWWLGIDRDGYNGCSRTYVAPDSPYGAGWIPADIPFGPMRALGIGIELAAPPVAIKPTTWGRLKSLYGTSRR